MKVIQGKKFSPIHITLENEVEAQVLWHILNCGAAKKLDDYLETHSLAESILNKKSAMWKQLDNVYNSVGEL